MRNASGSFWCSTVAVLQQVLGPQDAPHGLAGLQLMQRLGAASPGGTGRDGAMPPVPAPPPLLFRALASLNLLLLVGYLLLVLLAKLFARLHLRATAKDHTTSWYHGCDDNRAEAATDAEDAAADDVVEGHRADTLFWFDEAVFEDTALLLGGEGKDHLYATTAAAAARCLQEVESTFPVEESAPRISPGNQDHRVDAEAAEPKQQVQEEAKGGVAVDVPMVVPEQRNNVPLVTSPEKNVSVEGKKESSSREEDARRDTGHDGRAGEEDHAAKSISGGQHDVKLFVNSRALADTRKLLLEGVVAGGKGGGGGAQLQDDKDRNGDSSRFGASTLASESTSKSSVEWRSSTVTKDSETEYPFSSSSRRSSARWESYTLFRKYDEDMVYFHRVGAQKLTETESFRSIKYQPRSMSERIVQKLTPKPSAPIGLRDPYPDLERAYVAQVCLTWEALNWNYTSFRRHNGGDGNIAARCCPARVAQEFQQFQVLLHRFIENEPYEYGRRPEVYARMKNSTPKLLLVPEFRDEEDEKDDLISAVQFLLILEESIRTFMTFLRADKRSHYEMFREMVKRRSSAVDQTLVIALKRANKRKKSRLKDLTRPRRCLKRTKLREEEELSILLGLIDLKVVARVLRMPEVTDQQLHWCEEKMNRVRVDLEGRMQRDPSPLFYPAH
ncbi:hypothetical protein GQ55_5G462900 [Panicum hallii var. hallii]|uniref:Uncharacterized protein n=1 Tax=Panicum hallii var. hallii TaxID=1504633 RepID=A0A2T7DQJ6_9POAL|nr:uncharacterized protein LOC112891612 isoform X2 [Panicum hallii]PUZ57858.1 hypothetical protein GQ55_5G462900 [Panicum hallii var. hallii]